MEGSRNQPTVDLNVFIHQIIVHDDRDPGPGRGEYDVAFAAAAGPGVDVNRVGTRWQGSVSSGRTYEVRRWTGPVAVRADGGWLSVAGGGVERDLASDDAVLGGLATLRPEQEWGIGRWWRTTNGPHFDFVFCVVHGEGADAARPIWTGETYDAPGPAEPTPAEYRAILGG